MQYIAENVATKRRQNQSFHYDFERFFLGQLYSNVEHHVDFSIQTFSREFNHVIILLSA